MQNVEECRAVVRQLWPYLDGVLPDEWQERVVAHLEGCTACRSHYDFERAFLDAVQRSMSDDAGFAPLRERVLTALAASGMAHD